MKSIIRLIPVIIIFISAPLYGQGVPCLTGFVTNGNGDPVFDADLDFDNAITGRRLFTPNDNTDATGFYRVCVVAGLYHVSYAPPLGTHYLGKQVFNFQLNESQVLNITLNTGVVISGVARDSLGIPVPEIDFDADTLNGGRVYTPNDNTDTSGAYWLVVPPGTYRLRGSPPAGSRYLGIELDSVVISNDTTIDFTMRSGHLLSGHVSDSFGGGLDSIQIDVRDFLTGAKIFVTFNETDSIGNYSLAVPEGTFNLRFAPPYGSGLVAAQEDSIVVTTDLTWNESLSTGIVIDCAVTDSSGNPLAGVDFDFTDESTAVRAFTPYDVTNSLGQTIVAILPDTYTVRVDPPQGSLFDRLTITGLALRNDTTLAFILPEVGRVSFAGRVIDRFGRGMSVIEITMRSSATGVGVSLSNNVTDTLGYFNLAAPIGSFDVSFSPPRGSHNVAQRFFDIVFSVDTTWSEVVLDTGVIFSARVFDIDGPPLSEVDFDFVDETTRDTLFTPHDNTDITGAADITLPIGTYTINISPPAGSLLSSKVLTGVNISADTSADIFLSPGPDAIPFDFRLRQNYPNPFNAITSIAYTLLRGGEISINIYNAIGQRVRVVDRGYQEAGHYVIEWDASDGSGGPVASGLYVYQLRTSSGSDSKKMIYVK